jgi:hypothetical protein
MTDTTAAPPTSSTPHEDIRDQTYLQTKLLRSISNSINNIELFLVKSSSLLEESQQSTRDLISKLDTSVNSIICLFQEYRDTNSIKTRKFFVVVNGHTPGIYDNFDMAKSQIEDKPNAYIRAFDDLKHAKEFNEHIAGCNGCQSLIPPSPSTTHEDPPSSPEESKTSL